MFIFLSYRKNFVGTENKFERAMVNEPSVFKQLRFYCICQSVEIKYVWNEFKHIIFQFSFHLQ